LKEHPNALKSSKAIPFDAQHPGTFAALGSTVDLAVTVSNSTGAREH
jgi:hypothetical protein